MADSEKARKEAIRQIKIKTGVVKRLHKEYFVYEKEVEKEAERLQKWKDEGKDEHDIRKQQEVMDESKMMLPDTKRKFLAAYSDLENLLAGSADYNETEEFKTATGLLETTKDLKG